MPFSSTHDSAPDISLGILAHVAFFVLVFVPPLLWLLWNKTKPTKR